MSTLVNELRGLVNGTATLATYISTIDTSIKLAALERKYDKQFQVASFDLAKQIQGYYTNLGLTVQLTPGAGGWTNVSVLWPPEWTEFKRSAGTEGSAKAHHDKVESWPVAITKLEERLMTLQYGRMTQ